MVINKIYLKFVEIMFQGQTYFFLLYFSKFIDNSIVQNFFSIFNNYVLPTNIQFYLIF